MFFSVACFDKLVSGRIVETLVFFFFFVFFFVCFFSFFLKDRIVVHNVLQLSREELAASTFAFLL